MNRPMLAPARLVVLAGVCAAMHVGKLPTAIPVLRDAFAMSLVEAGFLLSLVQLAGMVLGVAVGAAADGVGLKRTMAVGLLLVSAASISGAFAPDARTLLALRAVEGLGFLLASMPAPSLIRRVVAPERVSAALGLWGAYMPLGTAIALLFGPPAMTVLGWQGWWIVLGSLSAAMALWLWWAIERDPPVHGQSAGAGWWSRLGLTLRSLGPWLTALSFAVYSAQWLAVIGFLPSIYAQAGFSAGAAGAATAVAALVNMIGNISSGRLLQRGARPQRLLYTGFTAMGLGALIAFAPVDAPLLRYAGVVLFSTVGGLVPGTLFSLSLRLAPNPATVSTSVGWMQQWSSIGQFGGPPLVAWVASRSGGWQFSGMATASFACAGLVLATVIGRALERRS